MILPRVLLFSLPFLTLLPIVIPSSAAAAPDDGKEVVLSDEELKKVDRFEEHTLSKADQTFNKRQYRQARAEYDAFIIEFPRSKLIPYALLRKGRSAQHDDKRFQAVADYKEILDYFPNDVKYAAAALYYVGECHQQNGDLAKAIKAWVALAEDEDYRREPLSAFAVNHLADCLVRQEKEVEAVKYYRQTAIDFRKSNAEASKHAKEAVVRYYVRSNPSQPEFRRFYTDMGTLADRPVTIAGDLTQDQNYWNTLRSYIRTHGGFSDAEAETRKAYYTYWAAQMEGRFSDDIEYGDDFHIERANFRLLANEDQGEWSRSLDRRYARLQGRADWRRTLKWIRVYHGQAAKIEQYFKRIDLRDLGKDGMVELMRELWKTPDARPLVHAVLGRLPLAEMSNRELTELAAGFHRDDKVLGQSLLRKVRWSEMDDQEIAAAAGRFWSIDGEVVKETCLRIKDKTFGKWELLRYYHSRHHGWNPAAGLPLADALIRVEKYSAEAWWAKGEFHDALKEYAKAIAAFQNCQNTPTNLWRIADCQIKLNKLESAVSQVREIENFFPAEAPKAALHIAHLYRNADEKNKYIQALRDVLKKYPQSDQSKEAHVELEKEGYKPGGGIDAD